MKTFKNVSIQLLILSFLIVPIFVLAQPEPTTPPVTIPIDIPNPFNCGGATPCTLMTLITSILNNVVMPVAAVAVVIWIVWAGFTFLTAQGKPAEIEKAKGRLLWSLIGAGILLGAAGISSVVQNTIGALINTPTP